MFIGNHLEAEFVELTNRIRQIVCCLCPCRFYKWYWKTERI